MRKIIEASLALGMFSFATASQGALIQYTVNSANDCAGYFGDNLESCAIAIDDEIVSPIISKTAYYDDGSISEIETNPVFSSIDGNEFSVTFDDNGDADANSNTGSWDYAPTGNDPAVRFWVAKSSNEFNLFWQVADSEIADGGACVGTDVYNLACLNAAEIVTSGDWSTVSGGNLSHITYYDTGVVPVPAAVWLFGSGLLGLVGVARRKSHA